MLLNTVLASNHINPRYDSDEDSQIENAQVDALLNLLAADAFSAYPLVHGTDTDVPASAHHTKFTEADVVSLNQTQMEGTEPPAQLSAYPLVHGTDLDIPATAHHDPATQDVDKVDGYDAMDLAPPLTVSNFQGNAGTGTATSPQRLNDNDTTNNVIYDAVNEYVQIDFPGPRVVREFRYYGDQYHNEDGTYKIQYDDGGAWVDLNTGIATRPETWSNWISLTKNVITSSVRVVATALDSYATQNLAHEWEMRG